MGNHTVLVHLQIATKWFVHDIMWRRLAPGAAIPIRKLAQFLLFDNIQIILTCIIHNSYLAETMQLNISSIIHKYLPNFHMIDVYKAGRLQSVNIRISQKSSFGILIEQTQSIFVILPVNMREVKTNHDCFFSWRNYSALHEVWLLQRFNPTLKKSLFVKGCYNVAIQLQRSGKLQRCSNLLSTEACRLG